MKKLPGDPLRMNETKKQPSATFSDKTIRIRGATICVLTTHPKP